MILHQLSFLKLSSSQKQIQSFNCSHEFVFKGEKITLHLQSKFYLNMTQQIQYKPLQWPPDLQLAQLHYRCVKPGIDSPDGKRCPCCQRIQKDNNTLWFMRDITKDFKKFGGGIPGYFYLLIYLMVMYIILGGAVVVYHIILLEQVCPSLEGTDSKCAHVFGFFWACSSNNMINALIEQGKQREAAVFEYLQLGIYIFLVISTLGIKVFFHFLSMNSVLDQKLFSSFSLILKNVPLYYQLQDLKDELLKIVPDLNIQEIFYIHRTHEYESSIKSLVDLHSELKNIEVQLREGSSQKKEKEYCKKQDKYIEYFDQLQKEEVNLKRNSKKVVVVFNTTAERQKVHKHLRVNKLRKFWFYFVKWTGYKAEPLGYYSQKLPEPQEIHWKNIGESSTAKQILKVKTTLISLFMAIVAFMVFYFPMEKIDEQKVADPSIGTPLGFMIAIVIVSMMLFYRFIILRMIPTRRPSSRLSEGMFIVVNLATFFFFFYLLSPAIFYLIATDIPQNAKIGTFFMLFIVFFTSNIIVNGVDLGYRTYKSRVNKLLENQEEANNYYQGRLHQLLMPTPFPLANKLVVAFNTWSFNSYFLFNNPYLIVLFFGIVFFLYWLDKYILYKHYKTNQYLSLDLEHQAQKVVMVFFLICVSLGYYSITRYLWQQILIVVVFVVTLSVNFQLQFWFKRLKEAKRPHYDNLTNTIEKAKSSVDIYDMLNLKNEFEYSYMYNDPSFLLNQLSQASITSAVISYSYQESYELYMSQFSQKDILRMLQKRFFDIKKAHSYLSGKTSERSRKKRESELARLSNSQIKEKLITDNQQSIQTQLEDPIYKPPLNSDDLEKQNNKEELKLMTENDEEQQPVQKETDLEKLQQSKAQVEKQLQSRERDDLNHLQQK